MSFLILPRRFREQKDPFALSVPMGIVEAKYKVQICRNHEYVISEPLGPGFHKNLILNQALDHVMTGSSTSEFMLYSRLGSGTTPAAVTDTQLQTQTKSTTTPAPSGQATVSDTVNGYQTITGGYEFATETGSVTYNELGIGWNTTGTTLGTRALFPSAVNLTNGQNVRLLYTLVFSWPATVTPVTVSLAAINGFNISGSMKVCGTFNTLFGYTANNSSIQGGSGPLGLPTSNQSVGVLCSAPTTFPAVNTASPYTIVIGSSSVACSPASYTTGSFTRSGNYVFAPNNPTPASSTISMIAFLYTGDGLYNKGIYLILTTPQTKVNTNTLTITLSCSIARA